MFNIKKCTNPDELLIKMDEAEKQMDIHKYSQLLRRWQFLIFADVQCVIKPKIR